MAADAIAAHMRLIGCARLWRGGYRQPFSVAHRDLTGPIGLAVNGRRFTYLEDYGVLEGGPPRWARGAPVFVGHGSSDEWAAADVRGKIAVVVSGGPGSRPSLREQASQAGALGVLLLDTPGATTGPFYFYTQLTTGYVM